VTSDLTYPDWRHDCFAEVINRYRCTSIADGRRCQLWRDHAGDHAAATLNGLPPATHRRARRGAIAPRTWSRWADDLTVREQAPGSERLPWACMGSP
jgi:hypothetical protein